MIHFRKVIVYILTLVFTLTSITTPASDDRSQELLTELQKAYNQVYGNQPGAINVTQQTVNGVTTYYTSVSRCDQNNQNCKTVHNSSFRESVGFVVVDGHYYSVVTLDSYQDGNAVSLSPTDSKKTEPSQLQRLDFRAGQANANPSTGEFDISTLLQLRVAPQPRWQNELNTYLPGLTVATVDAYQNLQQGLKTSAVMHKAYQQNLSALSKFAQFFQTSRQNAAQENEKHDALMALTMANFADIFRATSLTKEQLEAFEQLEELKKDPLGFRQYELTPPAQEELQQKAQNALQEKNIRDLSRWAEMGLSQRDPLQRANFANKLSAYVQDGVVQVGRVHPEGGPSPLDERRFKAPIDSPAGQALRRTGNLAQTYWAEQQAYQYATPQAKTLYASALISLSAAENAFQRGRTAEAYHSLNVATQLLHGSIGFGRGLRQAGEALIDSLPEFGHAVTSLSRSLITNPYEVYEKASELIFQIPEITEALTLSAVAYGNEFIDGDAETRGEILGRISGEVLLGVATGGVTQTAIKAAKGLSLTTRAATALQKFGGMGTSFGSAISNSARRLEPKISSLTQKIFSGAQILGAKKTHQLQSYLQSFAHSDLRSLEQAEKIAKSIKKSSAATRAFEQTPPGRPAFYVKPNGEAIPATAYRHYGSQDVDFVNSIVKSRIIPEYPSSKPYSGNYVTFDKFDNSIEAQQKLQLYPNDAIYRVTVDTLDNIDDFKIPNGKWGEAEWLEPITKDFPNWGVGGATQAVTRNSIPGVLEVKNLKTGKVLYRR